MRHVLQVAASAFLGTFLQSEDFDFVSKPHCPSGFDLPTHVDAAFKKLEADVSLQAEVCIGESLLIPTADGADVQLGWADIQR